jgi:anaerobic selenocysteine-containing dehydrogenase
MFYASKEVRMIETSKTTVVRTVCGFEDGSYCGILAHVKDGVLEKVEPADMPMAGRRHICAKGLCSSKIVYHPDRLQYPMKRMGKRGEGRWKRISWEEAFETIARKFQKIGEQYGKESIAISTVLSCQGMGGLYSRLASAIGATKIGTFGYGDSAALCADFLTFGPGSFSYDGSYLDGLANPNMIVVWGGNFAETMPLIWRDIQKKKEEGAKLVVIDPFFTTSASKADEYIPIRPGTDTALALGMMKVILDRGLEDKSFMSQHTVAPFLVRSDSGLFLRESDIHQNGSNAYVVWDSTSGSARPFDTQGGSAALEGQYDVAGIECPTAFDLLKQKVQQYTLHKVSELTGISSDTIENLALSYVTAKPVGTYRGLGMQRTFHGDLAYRAVTALASLTGNIKLAGPQRVVLQAPNLTEINKKPSAYLPVLDMYDAILTGKPYPIKALFVSANNFVNQNANTNKVLNELFPALDFIVVYDLFMNASAQYADLVLPACTHFEFNDAVAAYFYVQLQQKAIEPLYEAKSHVDLINGIAEQMGLGEHFSMTDEQYIGLMLSSGHPSLEGITLDKLKQGPVLSRPFEVPVFSTQSGRIEFYCETMKPFGQELPVYLEPLESKKRPLAEKYPLVFIQNHTKYVKNSMFANVSWMRELNPEPVLEMNPEDAEKRGIGDGDVVVAFNDRGKVKLISRLHQGIRPGSVNIHQGWWPEHYKEGTHQALTQTEYNPAQKASFEPNMALFDNLVEVRREGE